MDKLKGYEIHFDLERNEISILKTPNFDDEKPNFDHNSCSKFC